MQKNLEDIKKQILSAANAANREPNKIKLLPVSKTQTSSVIREAYGLGLKNFAENYADELVLKAAELRDLKDLTWTFIGQLQSNKIKKIMSCASEIQTVTSEKQANYIDRYAVEYGKSNFPVWISVNVANESTKTGIDLTEAPKLATYIEENCSSLKLKGIMAIPPAEYNDANYPNYRVPEIYKALRTMANQIGQGKLSLGMTSDLGIAIAAGSDCVRIGTAIFGSRISK